MDRGMTWRRLRLSSIELPQKNCLLSSRKVSNVQSQRLLTTRPFLRNEALTTSFPVKSTKAYTSPILKARANFDQFYNSIQPVPSQRRTDSLKATQELSSLLVSSSLKSTEEIPEVEDNKARPGITLLEQLPGERIDSLTECMKQTDFSVLDTG